MEEEWKDIENYEKMYQVSNQGNIRSTDRYIKTCNNNIRLIKGKMLKLSDDKDGYKLFTFSKNNKPITARVHQQVAKSFIPNPEDKPQVNHINGIKYDNRKENLEWCTVSENRKHAYRIGLQSQLGEKNAASILTDDDVINIKKLLVKNKTLTEISKLYNCHICTISEIKQNRNWTHIIIKEK